MMRNLPPVFSQDQDLVKGSEFLKIHSCETLTRSVGLYHLNIHRSVFEAHIYSLKLAYYIWQ